MAEEDALRVAVERMRESTEAFGLSVARLEATTVLHDAEVRVELARAYWDAIERLGDEPSVADCQRVMRLARAQKPEGRP